MNERLEYYTVSEKILKMFIYMGLTFTMIIVLFPFLNLLAISFTDTKYISNISSLAILPKGFTWNIYKIVFMTDRIVKGIFNSIFITLISTIINIIITSMAAYALSRRNFIGKKVITTYIIITMLFNGGTIPNYMLIKDLRLIDSYWAVILQGVVNIYYLILMRNFFYSIPNSVIESAEIDGASILRVLFKIVLPLAKPAIATIGLYFAVFRWNEYFTAVMYLNSPDKWPLQVILRELIVNADKASIGGVKMLGVHADSVKIQLRSLQSAVIIITILPILFVFPFIQRYFTSGIMAGAVKE